MSWFNETFGDSLNSIKGKITKITKEVLAEDDNEKDDDAESIRSQLKELDALCSSKDLEIASLREENKKIFQYFQEELKLLRNENNTLTTDDMRKNENVLLGDDQMQQICELENELHQLRIERDHLEELQMDHQSNICLVVQQRDSYKSELERLKTDYLALELSYNDLLKQQSNTRVASALPEVSLLDIQNSDDDLVNLKCSDEELHSQNVLHQEEKEETSELIEKLTQENESLKDKIEKLMEEIKIVNDERENVELGNCNLKERIHCLQTDLIKRSQDFDLEHQKQYELQEELRKSVVEQSKLKIDLENQVNKLLNIFLINKAENTSLSDSIIEIENIWKKNLKEKENAEKILTENINKFQNEIQRLKNDKISLEHEIKAVLEKRNELECQYKEEIHSLQNKYLEIKSQEQDFLIKSQTDDVKRLDQEVSRLMEMVEVKNKELGECYNKINAITQELNAVKILIADSNQELLKVRGESEEMEKNLSELKINFVAKEKKVMEVMEEKFKIMEKLKALEDEKTQLLLKNESLQYNLKENINLNAELENEVQSLKGMIVNTEILQQEIVEFTKSKCELEKLFADVQQIKYNSDNQNEYLNVHLNLNEKSVAELTGILSEDVNKLKEETFKLECIKQELQKWKETMIEVQIRSQELSGLRELVRKECDSLRSQLKSEKDECDELEHDSLHNEALCKIRSEEIERENGHNLELLHSLQVEFENLRGLVQEQTNKISSLTYENNQLKHHIELTNGNLVALSEENNHLEVQCIDLAGEAGNIVNLQNKIIRNKLNVAQQHKRSKSDFDAPNSEDLDKLRVEFENLRQSLQISQKEYETLKEKYSLVSEKEAHSRKELERLKLHLIEIESYYTETIEEYKTKLNFTEEQLKSSSTVYTSTKVRDNQHLESLQSQIRLISAQRDDLQMKLSAAEDEVQRHKAALTSFHVVLEQFQLDKEREIESLSVKYENKIVFSEKKFVDFQNEIISLNNQLSDAKTGLKAAARLGEQLERKSEQIMELEQMLADKKNEMKELEETLALTNQSNFGKIDKSLVKNLLLGYISAEKGDRKSQVLRIMMSVLEFDEEERNKIGVDGTQSGWLSHLLHPKADGSQTSQSLSEAFIRFLENESRPQPRLKLLAAASPKIDKTSPPICKPQPSLLLQELVLPTFNSPETNESSILKDVLSDT